MRKYLKIFPTLISLIIFSGFALSQSDVTLSFGEVNPEAGTMEIYMVNPTPVYGFQFNISNLDNLTGSSGGLAQANGFITSTSPSGLVLGFSLMGTFIPAGEGVLTVLAFGGIADLEAQSCYTNPIFSGPGGAGLTVDASECWPELAVPGCMDDTACNYNPDATEDDESCLYFDCNDDCGGTAYISECGCVGGATGLDEDYCLYPDVPQNLIATGLDGQIALDWDAVDGNGNRADVNLYISSVTDTNIEIYMHNYVGVYGFQFNILADEILAANYGTASGGSAASSGLITSTNASGLVLGFSLFGGFIPPGEGVLTNISWTPGGADGFMTLGNGIISGPGGSQLSVEFGDPICYGECAMPYELTYNVYRNGYLFQDGLTEPGFIDGGLGLTETHCYMVTAFDGTYESDFSNEACATTFDCADVSGGDAYFDDCGNCVGGTTGLEENYAMDCDGVCNGTAFENECGCVGGTTGLAEYFCFGCTDPNAMNFCDTCTFDDGSCEYDVDPPLNLMAVGGMNEIVLNWDGPQRDDLTLYISNITDTNIEIYMVNTANVYGFQFNILADEVLAPVFGNASGGSAAASGLISSTNASGLVLGFSLFGGFIPAGEGVLTNIAWTPGGVDGFMTVGNGIISGPGGSQLTAGYGDPFCYGTCGGTMFTFNVYRDGDLFVAGLEETMFTDTGLGYSETHCYTVTTFDGAYESVHSNEACATTDEQVILGCTDDAACNFNPEATDDDGTCWYAEMYYDCDGNCLNDADADGVCDELEIFGCTDVEACNFDPEATELDDSCMYPEMYYDCDGNCLNDADGDGVCDELEIYGCTDENAVNYNPEATEDDESCEYGPDAPMNLMAVGGMNEIVLNWDGPQRDDLTLYISNITDTNIEIYMVNTANVYGFQFNILADEVLAPVFGNASGGSAAASGLISSTNASGLVLGFSLFGGFIPAGEGVLTNIAWTPGGVDGFMTVGNGIISGPGGSQLTAGYGDPFCYGTCGGTMFTFNVYRDGDLFVAGLEETMFTDTGLGYSETHCYTVTTFDGAYESVHSNEACATTDEQVILGCTDDAACNFNPEATDDDGTCWYAEMYYDCDGNCLNDADADGVCDELEIFGCTDVEACNFDPEATELDDSCMYPEMYYDCDGNCLNDADGDGVCDELEIYGCTDENAVNYNPEATEDDESCEYGPDAPMNLMAVGGMNEIALSWDSPQREDVILAVSNITDTNIEIYMVNTADVYGFQFNILADEVLAPVFGTASGGSAGANGLISSTNASGLVLGFSLFGGYIPAGEGVLTNIAWTPGGMDGFMTVSNAIMSGPGGSLLSAAYGDPFCYGTCGGTMFTYNVYRDGGLLIAGLEETMFTDTGLGYAEYHCYNVTAFDGMYESIFSNEDCAVTDPLVILGCTDEEACNFDPEATDDDGTCWFAEMYYDCDGNCLNDTDADGVCDELEIYGCTDVEACNFEPEATELDDSCLYAEMYYDCDGNCLMDTDGDGVCDELEIYGCTDVEACNFEPEATELDDSCLFAEMYYDCDGNCLNDTDADGVCDELEVFGCTDETAVNYNPEATEDDGSCSYTTHYLIDIEGTGEWQLVIFNDTITGLEPGDEIGVFDADGLISGPECLDEYGELLVGVGLWAGFQTQVSAIGSVNFCDFGGDQYPGWVDGNPIVVKVWRESTMTEYDTIITFGAGDEFGDLLVSIVELTLVVPGCTDETACNFDPNATQDDGSCEYPIGDCFDCDGNCVCEFDCNGECGGPAEIDDCGVCDGGNADMDCNGDCFGTAYENECGCVEGSTGLEADFCYGCTDPIAINFDENATIDDDSCEYEPGVLYFGEVDQDAGTAEIRFYNNTPWSLAGFQFYVSGIAVTGASGGLAQDYGFNVSSNSQGLVLGFLFSANYIPAGDDVLTVLTFDGYTDNVSCIYDAIMSGPPDVGAIPTEYGECVNLIIPGCTDDTACNFDPIATDDDGTCEYAEEYYDCDGNCLNDTDGDGVCDELEIFGCTDDSACNFDPEATELDDSCWYAEMYYDCDGNCLMDTDGDGVCDELEIFGCTDDSACNFNPEATELDDSCWYAEMYYDCDGNCLMDTDGDGVCDELEIFGCTDDSACNFNPEATELDDSCWYAEMYYDCDGNCLMDTDGDGVCDELEIFGCTDDSACNFNPEATELDDSCWYAEMYYDCDGNCLMDTDGDGVCDEMEIFGCTDNESCTFDEDATEDDGSCLYDDCWGDCGGEAFIDDCGICSGGNSGHEPGYDKDCFGDCFGYAYIDNCDECVGGNTGIEPCVQDCAGVWGGDAEIGLYYYDLDGDGMGSGIALNFCDANVPAGWVDNMDDLEPFCPTNDTDDCGVCAGNNEAMDCFGNCFGDAEIDICGECGGDGSSCNTPLIFDVFAETDEGIEVMFEADAALNPDDPDGGVLEIAGTTPPDHGTVDFDGLTFTYMPDPGYGGDDSFMYQVVATDDSRGMWYSEWASVYIAIEMVNEAPVAYHATKITNEDQNRYIELLADDPDGDDLTYVIETGPEHGVLIGTAPFVTYVPEANYNGPDSFTFTASDGTLVSNVATISITVTPVNDTPTALTAFVNSEDGGTFSLADYIDDIDGDALTIGFLPFAGNTFLSGQLQPLGNFEYQYTAPVFPVSQDFILFRANDATSSSNYVLLTIGILGRDYAIRDMPIISAPVPEILNEDMTKVITILALDNSGGFLNLATAEILDGVDYGTLEFLGSTVYADGMAAGFNYLYTPNPDYNGEDSFEIAVTSEDGTSDPAMVSITVNPVVDVPYFASIADQDLDEDTVLNMVVPIVNPDGYGIIPGISVTGTTNMTAVINDFAPDMLDITITPNPNFSGHGTVTVSLTTDGPEAFVDSESFVVDLIPLPDAPVVTPIADQQVFEDVNRTIFLSATDPDGTTTFTFSAVSADMNLLQTQVNGNQLTFLPQLNMSGSTTVSVTANDGGLDSNPFVVNVQVLPVNDAPVITSTAPNQVMLGDEYMYAVTVEDVDSDVFSYGLAGAPAGMLVSGDGVVTWTPDAVGYFGPITLQVYDNASVQGVDTEIIFIEVFFEDCAGIPNGLAYLDDCGECVGGTTGMDANWAQDCNGDCFGEAFENECGCVGGLTGMDEFYCYGCIDPAAVNFCDYCLFDDGSCSYTFVQEITLAANMLNNVSAFVQIEEPAVADVFSDIDLLLAKDAFGGFYVPQINVDLIGDWDLSNGYQVFINGGEPQVLAIEGLLAVPADTPINVFPYMMNNIGYVHNEPLNIADVMDGLPVLVVKDDAGLYYAPLIGINTIDENGGMQPGKGYQIFLEGDSAIEFTYPDYGMLARATVNNDAYLATLTQQYDIVKTGISHPIIITEISGDVSVGDELVAYAQGQVVGATRITDLNAPVVITAWGGYSDYGISLPGYNTGDAISLKLYSQIEGKEVALSTELNGSYYGLAPMTTGTATTDIIEVVDGFALGNNYPNPFNPVTTIEFSVPEDAPVTLAIYDVTGRLIQTLVSGEMNSGNHRIVWDGLDSSGDAVSAGMYLYTLRSADVTITKKMVMMK